MSTTLSDTYPLNIVLTRALSRSSLVKRSLNASRYAVINPSCRLAEGNSQNRWNAANPMSRLEASAPASSTRPVHGVRRL